MGTCGALAAPRTPARQWLTPLFRLRHRGTFFIEPGTKVYPGMVVGEYTREQDVPVNVCKTKQLTNMRAAGSDENVLIEPAHILTLEQAIEWLGDEASGTVEATATGARVRQSGDRDRRASRNRPDRRRTPSC